MTVRALGALPLGDAVGPGEDDSETARRMASWLKDGGRFASAALGERWLRAVADARSVAFAYSGESILFGAVTPSETRSRRPYGFAVFEERSDAASRGLSAAAPAADAAFFHSCAAVSSACRRSDSWEEAHLLTKQVPELRLEAHRAVAERFLGISAEPGGAHALFKALTGGAGPKVTTLLLDLARTWTTGSKGPRAVRLPLYASKAEATALFWLAVIRAAGRWTAAQVPSVFWTMGIDDAPWLQLQLAEPDVETFASLWSDAPDPAHVLDLRHAASLIESTVALPSIAACLERTTVTIGELLTTLAALP